tara:strand:- start:20492 stop:20992 length:501 start_codon:yes stop_codon:yes gene_type:complete
MKNLIRKILKEETNNDSYIVFVAGTNKTGISHQSQYDAFKNSVGETDKIIKYFNYDDHKGSNSELFKFLEENMLNVSKLVLFSAGCSLANKLTPYYIPKLITYCIEPWASENGKLTWNKMLPYNFYINSDDWRRGKGAMDGIPDENKNNLKSHTDALRDSTKKIFN